MSWIPGNVVVCKEDVEAELQLILFETIIGKKPLSREKVLQVLTNKDKIPARRKSVLDFTFVQAYKEAKKKKKYNLEDKLKYQHYSPLMISVEENNYELADELLKAGASVAFKNKDRRTALHIACKNGFPDLVQLLLSKSKQQSVVNRELLQDDCRLVINAKHKPNGWTPLMYAVMGGHTEVVKVLLKCKHLNIREVNAKLHNVFHIAAREGKIECLQVLCSDSRKLEVQIAVASVDQKGKNILHHACTRDDVQLLEWLLQTFEILRSDQYLNLQSIRCKKKFKEEDTTVEFESGLYTPFLVACEYQNLRVVKYLVEMVTLDKLMSSRCFKKDRGGISALHLAATHDDEELAKILVEKFADHYKSSTMFNSDDNRELTTVNDPDLRERQRKLLLDIKDEKGDTVLHVARSSSSRRVAKYVCEICKDLEHIKNADGKLPPDEKVYFIPPEIEKMGKHAVDAYMKALDEGECKIPYYSMLILGEQRVGKTSLYRQLVGKPFMIDLDFTKGIDKNTVETVDARSIKVCQEGQKTWKEVIYDPTNTFANAITEEAVKHMPEEEVKKKRLFEARSETTLMNLIKKLDKQLDPPPQKQQAKPVPPKVSTKKSDPVIKSHLREATLHPSQQPIKTPRGETEAHEPLQAMPNIEISEKPSQKASEVDDRTVKNNTDFQLPSPTVNEDSVSPDVSTATLEPSPPSVLETEEEEEEVEEIVQAEESGFMNRRQGISMAKKLKQKNRKKGLKDPELTLNTLDFAGQREYRPMHHCFISRRACYLVVFNIQDLMGSDASVHLENIRFWIHSINAHIYPPEKDQQEKDKTISRVMLVGTHSESASKEKLQDIEELLDKLRRDKRCVNHIIKLQSYNSEFAYNNFVPVENSCDIERMKDQYLKESGTWMVQESINELSKKLPFLKEDYPIKWLNFKERIEAMQLSIPVITMEELIVLAEKSRLSIDPLKGQDVAIKFLHDSGKLYV